MFIFLRRRCGKEAIMKNENRQTAEIIKFIKMMGVTRKQGDFTVWQDLLKNEG